MPRLDHALATLAVLTGCSLHAPQPAMGPPPRCAAPGPLDDVLTLSDVQAIGTHNSYHQQPSPLLTDEWAYTQPTLTDQLEQDGVRQLELDLHLSVDGVFEVFHISGADGLSSCPTFADCLGEVATWVEAHPCALPVVVWIEPKDDIDDPALGYQKLDGHYDDIDAAILASIPRSRLVTPDDVRGDHERLPDAIVDGGWPTLARLRGHVLISFIQDGDQRAEYLDGHPALAGRAAFFDSDHADQPWAATFKIDDAARGYDHVQELVAAGFMVTSNTDSPDDPPRVNQALFDATLAAGSQFLSTNAPAGAGDYTPTIPGGTPARCNPVAAPADCTPEALEIDGGTQATRSP